MHLVHKEEKVTLFNCRVIAGKGKPKGSGYYDKEGVWHKTWVDSNPMQNKAANSASFHHISPKLETNWNVTLLTILNSEFNSSSFPSKQHISKVKWFPFRHRSYICASDDTDWRYRYSFIHQSRRDGCNVRACSNDPVEEIKRKYTRNYILL